MYSFFNKRRGGTSNKWPEGFLTSERFQQQLLMERARADRAGAKFSMLTFQFDMDKDSEGAEVAEQTLVHVLSKQSRAIDTKGAYDAGLALIMPYTPSEKAEKVWTKIQTTFKHRMATELEGRFTAPELKCELYVYPSTDQQRQLG